MVLLHAIEQGIQPPRVSTDLDALVNARVASDSVRRFVSELESRGFALTGASPEGLAHRYDRDGVSIDVLAPEGLGQRSDLTTTPPGHTLQVPGGTQALKRTEFVPVQILDTIGLVPRPSLRGPNRPVQPPRVLRDRRPARCRHHRRGTGPNTTDEVRKAYILQYAPAEAELLSGDPAQGPPAGRVPCDAPERQYPVARSGRPVTPSRI